MSELIPYNPHGYVPQLRDPNGAHSPIPEGYPEREPELIGLKDYLAMIRRHIWLVLGILSVAVAVTLFVITRAPPRYRAAAVVRLADTRRAMTGVAEAGAYDEVLGRETDLLLSQVEVLESRAMASEAVDREGLRLQPASDRAPSPYLSSVRVAPDARLDTIQFVFNPDAVVMRRGSAEITGAYGQPLTLAGVTVTVPERSRQPTATFRVASRNEAIGTVLENFQANPRHKTDIIDLIFIAGNPGYAQRVVNAMATTFQLHNATGAQQQSRRRRIFLEDQMRQTNVMLQKAMADYSSFRSRQQVFSSKEKASAQQTGIMDVEMKRADLDAERRTYASLLAQAQRSRQGMDASLRALVSSPGIGANPVIQQLYGQLTAYERARDSLVTSGAARTNPDVIALNSQITSTGTQLLSAVGNQIESLNARIASLDALKARSSSEIATLPRTETEETQLGQQVQSIQKIADQLQEEHQKAKMAEAVEAGQVEIVDLADAPTLPIAAGRTRKLALGTLIGLILGIGAAITVDGMNTSIRRRDEMERVLQVPGLAVIPQFASPGGGSVLRALPGRSTKARSSSNGQSGVGSQGTGQSSKVELANGLVTMLDGRSSGAEAFRTLRTNLIFSQAVKALRTIVVTSPSPGEGKTTTVANLAVSFAQQGLRVLLIDCDLRRARLHKVFSISRVPGMTELVLGHETAEAVTRHTAVAGLYVIPSGQLPPNPSELLGGDRMRKALESLSEAYDLILLDTPPLLAASDAAILATLADGAVLVVRAGGTEIDAGQQAIQQLTAVGARVVGAVLNDPDAKAETYGGYYQYDYAGQEG